MIDSNHHKTNLRVCHSYHIHPDDLLRLGTGWSDDPPMVSAWKWPVIIFMSTSSGGGMVQGLTTPPTITWTRSPVLILLTFVTAVTNIVVFVIDWPGSLEVVETDIRFPAGIHHLVVCSVTRFVFFSIVAIGLTAIFKGLSILRLFFVSPFLGISLAVALDLLPTYANHRNPITITCRVGICGKSGKRAAQDRLLILLVIMWDAEGSRISMGCCGCKRPI